MKILILMPLLGLIGLALAAEPSSTEEFLAAVRKGDADAVRKLLQTDPLLVNARGSDGVAAVRLAVYYRHPEIVRELIGGGAVLDVYDAAATGEMKPLRDGLTSNPKLANSLSTDGAAPLGLAAFFGHRDAVEFLLDHGAKIDMLSTNPAFPFAALHSAMSGEHKDIFDLLLARGADVNVREGGGFTILHEAAAIGDLEYVQLLLKRGANPSAKTDDGKLPEDIARARHHDDVANALTQARGSRPVR